jgi:hypothetical protein
MLRTLVETDDLLINSWLSRKWATFIRVWFVSSIAVTVVAFLLPFIFIYVPFFIYNVVVSVMALIFGGPPKLLATTFFRYLQFGAALRGSRWIVYAGFYSAGNAA